MPPNVVFDSAGLKVKVFDDGSLEAGRSLNLMVTGKIGTLTDRSMIKVKIIDVTMTGEQTAKAIELPSDVVVVVAN